MNSDEKSFSAGQCRAARALLNWSREDLARESKVSRAAIADFETDKRAVRERTTDDLRAALEAAGIQFIPQNGGGAGVRMRSADPVDTRAEVLAAAKAAEDAAEAAAADDSLWQDEPKAAGGKK